MEETQGLILVSAPVLLCVTVPLVAQACLSYYLGLDLESPIAVGTLRAAIQLTVLGAILQPILTYGVDHAWLVLLYLTFMICLASVESTARSQYTFPCMLQCVLVAFVVNIGLVAVFAFGFVIRPNPLWDPQYVIPIIGMLLGNCINGVALSMNSILVALVEHHEEIELYLSFGASPREASARLVRESVRVGAMPMLNSMAVIGLVSIPGMMTGQVLGGSPVWEAARYQMLIIYLIAMTSFGTILCEVSIVMHVGFNERQILCTHRFAKRKKQMPFLERVMAVMKSMRQLAPSSCEFNEEAESDILMTAYDGKSIHTSTSGTLDLLTASLGTHDGTDRKSIALLEVRDVKRSVTSDGVSRALFFNLCKTVRRGQIIICRGPSGIGKSQLVRLIGGLSPMDEGDLLLEGTSVRQMGYAKWRSKIRYVSQHKIAIPGTPSSFVQRVSEFSALQRFAPSFACMLRETGRLVQAWGLSIKALDQEWKDLSGGEGQRVFLAIALASNPKVLLMDESTSALDAQAKAKVEKTIFERVRCDQVAVIFVTHDEDQIDRILSA